MKRISLLKIVACVFFCALSSNYLHAQNKILHATYLYEAQIPQSVQEIEFEQIKQMAISKLKENDGVYHLYVDKSLYFFTDSKNNKKIKIEGAKGTYINLDAEQFISTKFIADKKFMVQTKYIPLDWKILTAKKKIDDKTCIQATCNTGTIQPEVWFCPEIPNQGGPYGKIGLPGLVMFYKDAWVSFTLQMVEMIDPESVQLVKPNEKTISEEEFERLSEQFAKSSGHPTDQKPGVSIIIKNN